MCLGGNENARTFFKSKGWHNLHSNVRRGEEEEERMVISFDQQIYSLFPFVFRWRQVEEKYRSRAARLYKASLDHKITQARRQGITPHAAAGGHALPEVDPAVDAAVSGLDALALHVERQAGGGGGGGSGRESGHSSRDSPAAPDASPSASPQPLASNFVDVRHAQLTLQVGASVCLDNPCHLGSLSECAIAAESW